VPGRVHWSRGAGCISCSWGILACCLVYRGPTAATEAGPESLNGAAGLLPCVHGLGVGGTVDIPPTAAAAAAAAAAETPSLSPRPCGADRRLWRV